MFTLQLTPTRQRNRNIMPSAKELGKSFRVLELSLSCQLRQLAHTILDMDSDEEKERNALLAVTLISERFTAFQPDEIMWYLCEHMRRIEYEKLEQELCNYAQASHETISKLDQNVHVLVTELAQTRKELGHYLGMQLGETLVNNRVNPGNYDGLGLIRDNTVTGSACENPASAEPVTKRKRKGKK
jgi:hypothetical protein